MHDERPYGRGGRRAAIERYYRLHARIYDATRWSFLFGRGEIVRKLAAVASPRAVLEVGCGTGSNLRRLCRAFPQAEITGLDVSAAMLDAARRKLGRPSRRVRLLHGAYDAPVSGGGAFDLALFSYSLSMINPGWRRAIDCARDDLGAGGLIAVVDFHESRSRLFERWMRANHVQVAGHLLPVLKATFRPRLVEVRSAYLGLWSYLTFIGSAATRLSSSKCAAGAPRTPAGSRARPRRSRA